MKRSLIKQHHLSSIKSSVHVNKSVATKSSSTPSMSLDSWISQAQDCLNDQGHLSSFNLEFIGRGEAALKKNKDTSLKVTASLLLAQYYYESHLAADVTLLIDKASSSVIFDQKNSQELRDSSLKYYKQAIDLLDPKSYVGNEMYYIASIGHRIAQFDFEQAKTLFADAKECLDASLYLEVQASIKQVFYGMCQSADKQLMCILQILGCEKKFNDFLALCQAMNGEDENRNFFLEAFDIQELININGIPSLHVMLFSKALELLISLSRRLSAFKDIHILRNIIIQFYLIIISYYDAPHSMYEKIISEIENLYFFCLVEKSALLKNNIQYIDIAYWREKISSVYDNLSYLNGMDFLEKNFSALELLRPTMSGEYFSQENQAMITHYLLCFIEDQRIIACHSVDNPSSEIMMTAHNLAQKTLVFLQNTYLFNLLKIMHKNDAKKNNHINIFFEIIADIAHKFFSHFSDLFLSQSLPLFKFTVNNSGSSMPIVSIVFKGKNLDLDKIFKLPHDFFILALNFFVNHIEWLQQIVVDFCSSYLSLLFSVGHIERYFFVLKSLFKKFSQSSLAINFNNLLRYKLHISGSAPQQVPFLIRLFSDETLLKQYIEKFLGVSDPYKVAQEKYKLYSIVIDFFLKSRDLDYKQLPDNFDSDSFSSNEVVCDNLMLQACLLAFDQEKYKNSAFSQIVYQKIIEYKSFENIDGIIFKNLFVTLSSGQINYLQRHCVYLVCFYLSKNSTQFNKEINSFASILSMIDYATVDDVVSSFKERDGFSFICNCLSRMFRAVARFDEAINILKLCSPKFDDQIRYLKEQSLFQTKMLLFVKNDLPDLSGDNLYKKALSYSMLLKHFFAVRYNLKCSGQETGSWVFEPRFEKRKIFIYGDRYQELACLEGYKEDFFPLDTLEAIRNFQKASSDDMPDELYEMQAMILSVLTSKTTSLSRVDKSDADVNVDIKRFYCRPSRVDEGFLHEKYLSHVFAMLFGIRTPLILLRDYDLFQQQGCLDYLLQPGKFEQLISPYSRLALVSQSGLARTATIKYILYLAYAEAHQYCWASSRDAIAENRKLTYSDKNMNHRLLFIQYYLLAFYYANAEQKKAIRLQFETLPLSLYRTCLYRYDFFAYFSSAEVGIQRHGLGDSVCQDEFNALFIIEQAYYVCQFSRCYKDKSYQLATECFEKIQDRSALCDAEIYYCAYTAYFALSLGVGSDDYMYVQYLQSAILCLENCLALEPDYPEAQSRLVTLNQRMASVASPAVITRPGLSTLYAAAAVSPDARDGSDEHKLLKK